MFQVFTDFRYSESPGVHCVLLQWSRDLEQIRKIVQHKQLYNVKSELLFRWALGVHLRGFHETGSRRLLSIWNLLLSTYWIWGNMASEPRLRRNIVLRVRVFAQHWIIFNVEHSSESLNKPPPRAELSWRSRWISLLLLIPYLHIVHPSCV